jgi:hypothetical protein
MGSTTSLLALSAPPAVRVAPKTQATMSQRLLAAQPAPPTPKWAQTARANA